MSIDGGGYEERPPGFPKIPAQGTGDLPLAEPLLARRSFWLLGQAPVWASAADRSCDRMKNSVHPSPTLDGHVVPPPPWGRVPWIPAEPPLHLPSGEPAGSPNYSDSCVVNIVLFRSGSRVAVGRPITENSGG